MAAQIKPSDFLNWLADRLVTKHGEDPNADFILTLRGMATDMEVTEEPLVEQPKK